MKPARSMQQRICVKVLDASTAKTFWISKEKSCKLGARVWTQPQVASLSLNMHEEHMHSSLRHTDQRDINYFMQLKMFFAVSFDRTSSLLKHLRCYQFHWWLYCDEVTQASSSLCFTNACDNLSIVWTEHNTAMAIHTLCREERFASKTSFSRSLPWATIGRILT